jgi:hypothetical protein
MTMILIVGEQAQSQAGFGHWVTEAEIGVALITALFTIVGILLKDFVLKMVEERRSETKVRRAIYDRYSNPLVTATSALLNRLYEILFQEHRHVYLRGKGVAVGQNPGWAFRAYKKLSTIYRLAVVLGWIRACRREYSYLRIADPSDTKDFDEAIDAFENALADGSWVEQERVIRLCELWHISKSDELMANESFVALGTKVDNLIWDHLESMRVEDVSLLEDASRQELCGKVADCISSHLKTNAVGEALMLRSWPDALNIIGMRETWVYHDWQSAIGDIMIQPCNADTRRFEVIGYGDFEQILTSGTPQQRLALTRLLEVFDNLDLSIEDGFDCRPRQIRAIAQASAKLILAIDKIQGNQSIVSQATREKAAEVAC